MMTETDIREFHRLASPSETVEWIKNRFAPERLVMTTAFGMEGCALVDLCARAGMNLTVADIDTGFLFPETHRLREQLRERYPSIRFETFHPTEEDRARDGDDREPWVTNPEDCCHRRKVLPLKRILAGKDVWLTGIRRTQSRDRGESELVQWDWTHLILKISPLAWWEREQVWNYVRENDVPHNPLHHQGYPSIGCTHCTQPVVGIQSPAEYSRDGRWAGREKTECGLHYNI